MSARGGHEQPAVSAPARGAGLRVARAGDDDRRDWNDYLGRQPGLPPLGLFEWADVLKAAYGVDAPFFIARGDGDHVDGGRVRGVLAAYVVHTASGRRRLYSTRHGFVADDAETAAALAAAATGHCRAEGVAAALVTSGCREFALPCRSFAKATVVVALGAGEEAAWRGLRDKTRNAIRKGAKSGLSLARGAESLGDFYAAYAARIVAKDVPLFSYRYFEKVIEAFAGRSEVLVARRDGEAVAGIVVLFGHDTAIYLAGGARPGSEAWCPNQFLLWEAARECLRRGIRALDLGESTVGGGVYRFKTLFGGDSRPVHYYDLLRPASGGAEAPPLEALAARAAGLGRGLVRFLPPSLKRRALLLQRRWGRLA